MKRCNKIIVSLLLSVCASLPIAAQGWQSNYGGVMLQGFYWDSYTDSKWTTLEKQADELSEYFSLIWIPQSGNCDGTSMGYNPKYYWDQNSSFGSERELRSMISTFKSKGLGTIADVVINHRQNVSNWVDFPAETYKGVTYQMKSTDICADDDGGKCKTWADANGYQLSPNKDSGEGWDGMRDLDHASDNVQKSILAYENYLLNDLGYAGFRYDVAKGFAAKYFALYNSQTKPQFSVGEVWDGNQVIKDWIDATKTDGVNTFTAPQSAAFDFQFRYQVRDAINKNNWSYVAGSNCLIKYNSYKQYAVTFIENHDTEKRSNADQDPILKDTLAANAYLLAMPGTPCVFFKHWQAYKKEIKLMIEARRMMGINNQSAYVAYATTAASTAICVTGTKGKLIVALGPNASTYTRSGFKVLMEGPKFRYLVEESFDTSGWADIVEHVNATTADPNEGQEDDGEFVPHKATVYVSADFTPVYYYVWVPCDNNKQLNGNWPGKQQTETMKIGDKTWYYQTFDIPTKGYEFNIILNQGSGKPQTADICGLSSDRFYTATISGGKVYYTDVTDDYVQYLDNPADVNNDGVVDISDINAIINVITGNFK